MLLYMKHKYFFLFYNSQNMYGTQNVNTIIQNMFMKSSIQKTVFITGFYDWE